MQGFVRRSATTGEVALRRVPVPDVGDHEVIVEVHAFGVGVHDRLFIPPDARFPYVIGTEGAGTVVAAGARVDAFAAGDRVLVTSAMNPKGGSWAEFVVVAPTLLTRVPRELDLHLAAGIPIAGKTALECLHRLDLGAGQTLFVAGGSGAIGTLVIQMAATRGLRVASSASARNQDYLLALGAELAVDYAAPDWEAQVREWAPGGADAALAIRPGTATPSVSVVREHGHVVTVSGDAFTPARAVRVEQLVHRVDPLEAMRDLVAAVACGELRVFLEWVYQFQDAVKALRKTETGHARGKLVVAV